MPAVAPDMEGDEVVSLRRDIPPHPRRVSARLGPRAGLPVIYTRASEELPRDETGLFLRSCRRMDTETNSRSGNDQSNHDQNENPRRTTPERAALFRAPSFIKRRVSSQYKNVNQTSGVDCHNASKHSVLRRISDRIFTSPVSYTPDEDTEQFDENSTNKNRTTRLFPMRLSLSKDGPTGRKHSLSSNPRQEPKRNAQDSDSGSRRLSLDQNVSVRRSSRFFGLPGVRNKLADVYSVSESSELLGSGTFAEVRVGYHRATMERVAVKTIDVVMGDREVRKAIECEKRIAKLQLRHLHIVRVHHIYTSLRNTHLVMELMIGSLEEILKKNKRLTENQARLVMHHLLQSMVYLREKNVVHRDIKPDNLLFTSNKHGELCFKLCDFGLAESLTPRKSGRLAAKGTYGTPFFASPEVINNEEYDCSADMWSAGVMLYVLLSGVQPFDGPNPREVMRRARTGRLVFPRELWDEREISSSAQRLIRSMVRLGPGRRPTPKEALNSPWFAELPEKQYTFVL